MSKENLTEIEYKTIINKREKGEKKKNKQITIDSIILSWKFLKNNLNIHTNNKKKRNKEKNRLV